MRFAWFAESRVQFSNSFKNHFSSLLAHKANIIILLPVQHMGLSIYRMAAVITNTTNTHSVQYGTLPATSLHDIILILGDLGR